MIIVGVGIGPKMLTPEAREAINQARLIYGSKRSIDLEGITSLRDLRSK